MKLNCSNGNRSSGNTEWSSRKESKRSYVRGLSCSTLDSQALIVFVHIAQVTRS